MSLSGGLQHVIAEGGENLRQERGWTDSEYVNVKLFIDAKYKNAVSTLTDYEMHLLGYKKNTNTETDFEKSALHFKKS